jgi:glycosyltransferase involved in cell wall biosynthesis
VVDVPVRPIYGPAWKSGIDLRHALHPLPWVLARSWAQRLAAESRRPVRTPMRIGVITTSYPRFAGDPAGGFVAAHVAALRALGHEVEVVAAGEGTDRIPSDLFYKGGAPDALERGGSTRAALTFTARLAAEVARRASRWDLIVAHWLAPSALAALPNRVPLLAIAHGGDVHTLARMRLLGPMLHALRVRRAQLVFVSGELREVARRHGPVDGSIVQPMGVDVGHFARLGRAPTDPPTVLVVARLVPIKGVDVAIAAMRHVDRPARLVVAGDGPERERLYHPDVELLGAVDTTRRDQLLRSASVVVVPSRVLDNGRTEGMPTIALEALAAGVPLIASAVGGLRSLAAASLVPPDDPGLLAASIDRVLAAPPADHALRASVAELDWPRVARRLLDVTPRTARRDA